MPPTRDRHGPIRDRRPPLSTALMALLALILGSFAVSPNGTAMAQSAPGSIAFANGFTDARFTAVVDPGTPSQQTIDIKELRTLDAVDVTPGTHSVEIFEGQNTTGSPVAVRSIDVSSGGSASLAVHPTESGTIATTVFANDTAPTGSATSRLVVRHIAQTGGVNVELRPSPSSPDPSIGTTSSFDLTNGQQGVQRNVVAQENLAYELVITPAGSASPLIVDTELVFEPGVELTVLIAGNPPVAANNDDPQSLLQRETDVGKLPPPTVNLVNGFSTGQYVFYVDGTQNASIEALRRNGVLQGLNEGTYTVEAYLNSGTPGSGSPAASIEIGVCDGQSYDLAIHADPAGDTTMSFFENDVTSLEPMTTRFTVRHIAEIGPLDVTFDGSGENPPPYTTADFELDNGSEYVIDDAIVNDYAVTALNPGTATGAVARNNDVEGEGGATQIAYIMGTPPGETEPLIRYLPYAGEPVIPTSNPPGSDCTSGTTDPNPDTGTGNEPLGNVFTPLPPARILDTREPTLGHQGKLADRESITVQATGVGGVPSSDVSAVVVNLTAAETDAPGFLTATPTAPSGDPTTSNVNFTAAGQARATMTTVPLADDGTFVVTGIGGTHAIADVLGYYTEVQQTATAGRFVPLSPFRFFDTRTAASPAGRIPAGGFIDVPVLGVGDVPATGVSAVVFNLTAAAPSAPGFLSASPGGTAPQGTSSLNYRANEVAAANQVVVPVGADGDVRITSYAETDALGDILGFFTDDTASASDSGLFVPVDPERVFDTRNGDGVPQGPLTPGEPLDVSMTSELSVGSDAVGAVSINATALNAVQPTFVSVNPTGSMAVSTINLEPNDVRANSVYTAVQNDGTVSFVSPASVDVLADINGYFRR